MNYKMSGSDEMKFYLAFLVNLFAFYNQNLICFNLKLIPILLKKVTLFKYLNIYSTTCQLRILVLATNYIAKSTNYGSFITS